MARAGEHDGLSSPIVDLRQYTLFPGTRDKFIDLFDAEFVETQEALGVRVIGQFRDMGDPNRFVWLRGFADMPAREQSLTGFYEHSEAWATHGEAARSKMIDSTDALLLRPARPESGFALEPASRRPPVGSDTPDSVVVARIHHFVELVSPTFLTFYDDTVVPAHQEAGGTVLGLFTTEYSPNNFPRLPLRENEHVFIEFCGFKNLDEYHEHMTALGDRAGRWRNEIYPELTRQLHMPPQLLRLAPTSRSQLHG
jgi:hypothetical protein